MQTYFQKKLMFISGVFLILSLAGFFVLYSKIKSNTEVSEKALRDLQIEAYRREKMDSLAGLVKKISKERGEIDSHFVRSSDVVPFLDKVESLAKQSFVDRAVVSTIDVSPDKSSLVMGVQASGSFESLYKFLSLLENSPYELSFSSVNFRTESSPETDSQGVLPSWSATFKIKLLSFIQ